MSYSQVEVAKPAALMICLEHFGHGAEVSFTIFSEAAICCFCSSSSYLSNSLHICLSCQGRLWIKHIKNEHALQVRGGLISPPSCIWPDWQWELEHQRKLGSSRIRAISMIVPIINGNEKTLEFFWEHSILWYDCWVQIMLNNIGRKLTAF